MMTTAMKIGNLSINELRNLLNSGKINKTCFRIAVKHRERKLLRANNKSNLT